MTDQPPGPAPISQTPAAQIIAPEAAQPPRSPVWRWVSIVAGVVILLVAALQLYNAFFNRPSCSSDGVKTFLSDVFKKNNVEATGYDSITTVSDTDAATECVAKLSIKDGRKLTVNYRITGKGQNAQAEITGSAFSQQ